ncbi:MAG: TonB family protein [Erythrobacter sp.]|uniref:TonB family protein n=1 Tax=Erythrobacter sp. TaxID=1042 RepID=UPI0032970F55
MKPLSLLYILGAAAAWIAAPASAVQQDRNQGGEETFVNLGRWIVVQDEGARACELRLTADPQVILRYRLADGRSGSLALQRKTGRFFTGMVGDVTWSFDDARFAGYQSGSNYSLSAGARDIEAAFRAAKTLYVDHGGNQLARIDLKTSSAGFRLLKQCAQQWRYIPWYRRLASANYRELEAPTTRSVRSTPTGTQPATREGGIAPPLEQPVLTRSVAARPINPAGWISNEDTLPWPSRGFREGRGILRYTLLVDENGRAEDCEVNRSTGSRRFDRQACRILMDRARFAPARGPDGDRAKAEYSASVRFAQE